MLLFLFILLPLVKCETVLDPTYTNYHILYDDISTITSNIWSKREVTWCIINSTESISLEKLLEVMNKVYLEWESISYLKFKYETEYSKCDNSIFFVDSVHNLNNKDKYFSSNSILAHAFYPPTGGIHFNNEVNWSRISLYSVALHEVGHTLGLSHVMDESSIMFPFYLEKPNNYSLKHNVVDETIIKKKYHLFKEDVVVPTFKPATTTFKPFKPTFKPVEPTQKPKYTNTKTSEHIYPGFKCVDKVDWCTDNLNFTNIFSLDNKLYLYKESMFWILEKKINGITSISKEKYSHHIYFNDNNNIHNLLSVVNIKNDKNIVLFFKDKLITKSLDNCSDKDKLKHQITLDYTGMYYNSTEDSMFFFSKDKPLSYSKINRFTSKNNFAEEKPIQLFKLSVFSYDKVFEFDNKVFFMKGTMLDYFDWSLKVLVKNISFKNYFLNDECDILPFIRH